MAKSQKVVKNSLFTLSLVAVLLLSVFVASDGFNLNIGSRAARSKIIETGTLVLPSNSDCMLGTHALLKFSGECVSVVASGAEGFVGKSVQVQGTVRDQILYASEIKTLGSNTGDYPMASPSYTNRPTQTRLPEPVMTPVPYPTTSSKETPISYPPPPIY